MLLVSESLKTFVGNGGRLSVRGWGNIFFGFLEKIKKNL